MIYIIAAIPTACMHWLVGVCVVYNVSIFAVLTIIFCNYHTCAVVKEEAHCMHNVQLETFCTKELQSTNGHIMCIQLNHVITVVYRMNNTWILGWNNYYKWTTYNTSHVSSCNFATKSVATGNMK